ncbi:hypothetical protein ACV30Q_15295 [Clostridium perfringens]|uniref:hypothetical protein n=1 Tax=Clostridium perfringens TaxID=1502 RepID=UPI0018E4398A|nr:hypothetical protein [Clostridium perfringens]EHA1007028.1 hypothetical protein [Clostridium perfringens]EHA1009154.1 hypothetical protein [Clostridium perfringens]EHA1021998.1 hypothetical protein [Clostridium perfringens]EHK2367302.1 hypothetical protein [Clostridium perfringens]MBI5993062.1 hypothetical protein [Clostridium perfringens]
MWPVGSYENMINDIKRGKEKDETITFGILIADYRQQLSREYILNYVDIFNEKSDRYINFYLPGYLEVEEVKEAIVIEDKKYRFDYFEYKKFLQKLESDFEIEFPYNPVLILIEYKDGHFRKTSKLIIELDGESNIKKTGDLFEILFEEAKKEVHLEDIKNGVRNRFIKNGLIDKIVDVWGNRIALLVNSGYKEIRKYKLV